MLEIRINKDTKEQARQRDEKKKSLMGPEGRYGATGDYLTRDGDPWYPVMGEFHFSRFHQSFWREEIAKMKAGGVEILATYVFWNHHEEKEEEWNFEGQRNLREFLGICEGERMPVFLRIGPWAHGECRNGGFPDWLVNRTDLVLRSDDPGYLALVERFWKQVYRQADGYLYLQGGPIIGIQIENEYGHCGGQKGEDGKQHMTTLKAMAVKLGFTAPYYTATGWGGGIVPEGCLPVLAAYCGAPWEQHTKPLAMNGNFVFTHYKDDKNVGSDLQVGEETGFSYDTEKFPYLMAELGGGLQVTSHRRPLVTGEDTASMALCKTGSGANLLGYYMYHGGTNPRGKYSSLQESKASGYSNDLPVRSYDFQAPIGEYGYVNDSFYRLRPLHLFLQEFGNLLCGADSILPPWNSENPEDMEGERISLRHLKGKGRGFLFYNRYQRHGQMKGTEEQIQIREEDWNICLPVFSRDSKSWGWLPYAAQETEGMVLTPGFRLFSSNYSLLCRLGDDVVFFGCGEPEVLWQGKGNAVCISSYEAEHGLKFSGKYFVSDGCLVEEKGNLYLLTKREKNVVKCYPEGREEQVCCESAKAKVSWECRDIREDYREYQVNIRGEQEKLHDLWICLEIGGDRGAFWTGDQAGDMEQPDGDWFYQGRTWRISWRHLGYPETLTVRVYPRKTEDEVYYEKEMGDETGIVKCWGEKEYWVKVR